MSNEKLTSLFDLPAYSSEDEHGNPQFKIEIPENATLDDITKLALTTFSDQMMDAINVEPKYRQRYLEVCQQYLHLAKDSVAKRDELKLKQAELEYKKSKDLPSDEKTSSAGIDRMSLLEQLYNTNGELN